MRFHYPQLLRIWLTAWASQRITAGCTQTLHKLPAEWKTATCLQDSFHATTFLGMGSIHLLYKHRNSNHQNISKFRLFSVFSFFLTYVSRHFALPFCLLWSFQPWCIGKHAMPVVWPSLAHKCSANTIARI